MKAFKNSKLQSICGIVLNGFKAQNSSYSTTQKEGFQEFVLIARSKSGAGNWPEKILGPINAINPKFPLPGSVGLIAKPSKMELPMAPATVKLPSPASEHYATVMLQTQTMMEDITPNLAPLVPDIDSDLLECEVNSCPQLVKSDLNRLFPDKDLSRIGMTAITLSHRTSDPTISDSEFIVEQEHLSDAFVEAAIEICGSLKTMGYWADFIHPQSGKPYLGVHTNASLSETDERLTSFGFSIDDLGCCKVMRSKHSGHHLFVGIVFTDAPKDHPVLNHLGE